MSHVFAVIMAGGVGSRFWPRSRERTPKQLLEIVGDGSMIQNTVTRIAPMIPESRIFVVTNEIQQELIRNQLPGIPAGNILVEPVGRNTAPCIALAARWIRKQDPDGVMVVLPADHIIRHRDEFLRILKVAVGTAEETQALLTIGIKPSHPETGYGYIQFDDSEERNHYRDDGIFRVKTFAEKPNLETAVRFLASGDFLWNSGMFVWKASSILREVEVHLPELHEQLNAVDAAIGTPAYHAALERAYGVIRGISIDYGVMEKAGNVFVVNGDFGWNDVGSWDEVVRLTPADNENNSFRGNVIAKSSTGNYVDAGNKAVALIGVDDLIVIQTDDALLICKKGRSQEVKDVVDFIRRKQMNEYL